MGRLDRFNGLSCKGGVGKLGGVSNFSGVPGISGIPSEFGGTPGYGGVGAHDCGLLPAHLRDARLTAWWKGESLIALPDGSQVSNWPDSTGNNYYAEQVLTRRPILTLNGLNGHPLLTFDANDWFYHYCYVEPTAIFAVARAPDRGRQQAIISVTGNTTGTEQVYNFGYGRGGGGGPTRHQWWRFPDNQTVTTQCESDQVPDGNWFTQRGTHVGNIFELYVNGLLEETVTNAIALQNILTGPAGRIGEALINSAEAFFWQGDIAEIMLYSGPNLLTALEVLEVEAYLNAKYNLNVPP